jgi:hypothetical protein
MAFDEAVHPTALAKSAGAKRVRRMFILPLAMTALILPNLFAAWSRD